MGITIDGTAVTRADLERSAHQDDTVWCYYHDIAAPPQDAATRALARSYRQILATVDRLLAERAKRAQSRSGD